ncbi:MAG: DUF2955 domain-containing protein [Thiotrichales bacterium]|nr:MAG: DUF2955 domain-containing protein [Thiotrichales bacterium]
MSTEAARQAFPAIVWLRALGQDQTSVRIIRYTLGVTLSAALAYAINWPLSFLLPILVSFMLSLPLPMPPLAGGLRNMWYTLAAFGLGLLFSLFFLQFPMVYLLMLALVMFHMYYYLNRGGSLWLSLMSFIAILLLSMLGNSHEGLATGVSLNFIWTGWLTVVMVWVAYLLVPDPEDAPFPQKPGFQPGYSQPAAAAALKSTAVIMPLASLFYLFDLTSYMLVMIFAALFLLKPELSAGKEAGRNSLISTLLGGAFAWVFYWLIVAVPEFYFYVALMGLTALYFGTQVFSGKPTAKYYNSALIALLILVNGSMGEGAEFTEKFIMRVILITLAVVYIVAALRVLDSFWPVKSSEKVNNK